MEKYKYCNIGPASSPREGGRDVTIAQEGKGRRTYEGREYTVNRDRERPIAVVAPSATMHGELILFFHFFFFFFFDSTTSIYRAYFLW